ncbi:MAG: adenylate/guanylate cyclase domain-containing protein [Chloroflexota bacterium]
MTSCPNCSAAVAADARFCASCGTALEATTAEERKVATILFADVTGSTDLGEQLDPERVRAMLQDYFRQMSRVIEEWAGTVEKYIGDAVLAVFGVPTAREDDPIRALNAATDMLAQIDRMNDDFESRHGVRLAVRIGVNTGEVLAPAGARTGGQFLVSGDPVNVASRLQEAAEPGSVMVGERTWAVARNAFSFTEPISLQVKGKREPVLARRLGAPTGEEGRGVRFQAPMVGRERELETLVGLLDEAIETEQPRLVVVSGSAGIGKSRMLREFISAATERHEGLVALRGRCLAAGHGITFWALGEILRAACGISLDEPVETAVEKLRRTVSSVLEPLGMHQNELDETFFALATGASLPVPGNPLERIEPEGVGEEMARAWPRFLTGLAARSPTTIVLEDLHWADERMVAMIDSLAGRSKGRLMLIGTARPEFLETHAGFAPSGELTVIPLRPLTEAQSERLVTELLGDSDPLQALLMDVRQKAEGNPFFLEEILQRLIDEGAIVRQDGRWVATERAQTVRLPDTIHALLAARIDALPTAEKALLQQAAVVGRIFWPGSLAAAANGRDPVDLLRALERRGLVSARTSSTIEGQPEYIFRHVLIRDVAYASVPKARRARAHAETGRWIETLAADRLDEFGELLAYHYAAAAAGEDADLAWADAPAERDDLRKRAFDALVSAGNAALRKFSVDRAIALHEEALALASEEAERRDANEALGDDHEALFHMDEALAAYLAAVEIEQRGDNDSDRFGQLVAKIASLARRWGAFRETPPHALIHDLIKQSLARDVSDRVRAELLIGSGMISPSGARTSSRTPLASEDRDALPGHIRDVEAGLVLAKKLDDPAMMYRAYEVLSLLYWHTGDIDNYREMTEREAGLLERLPSRRERVDVLVGMSAVRMDVGDFSGSLAAAEQAFQLADGLSLHERMHASFHVMWVAITMGDWDRALEIWPWHLDAAAREPDVNCPNVRGGPPLGAMLLGWRGELDRALELVPIGDAPPDRDTMFDRAILARYAILAGREEIAAAIVDSMASDPDRLTLPDGIEYYLETLADLNRFDALERMLPQVRRMAGPVVMLGPITDRAEATVALRRGDRDEACRLLEVALARFEELSVPFEVARTRELLAGLVDEQRSSELLRGALQTYDRLGAKPFADRVRTTLEEHSR